MNDTHTILTTADERASELRRASRRYRDARAASNVRRSAGPAARVRFRGARSALAALLWTVVPGGLQGRGGTR